MNNNNADCNTQNPPDQHSPSEGTASAGPEKNKIPPENVDPKTNNQCKERWPDRIVAIASIILVCVTASYTYYTRETLVATLEEMRLNQRAWLGYHDYFIQARENSTSAWENREPKAGEEFRGRFLIQNTGKTPALNIQLMLNTPQIVPIGSIPIRYEEWKGSSDTFVLFPNNGNFGHNTTVFTLSDQQFLEYSSKGKEIFFWAKINYCDITGRRHWTQIGVSHIFGSNEFTHRSTHVSPSPGIANHPDCQN